MRAHVVIIRSHTNASYAPRAYTTCANVHLPGMGHVYGGGVETDMRLLITELR